MAQRRSADGFIALLTSIASARRIFLALAVVVVFGVSGCGGDSDGETSNAAHPTEGSSDAALEGRGPSSSKTSSADTDGSSSDTEESSRSNTGKHGPHVAVPSGKQEPGFTAQQRAEAIVANISLSSPAIRPVGAAPPALPLAYTCDGKDSWPALQWQGIPSGTAELALFAMDLLPVNGKLFFDWAVAGLDPDLDGLEAGRLPRGAVVGRNSFGDVGYSICPPEGEGGTHVFALYALPRSLSPQKGFDPHTFRKQVNQVSDNVGLMAVSYTRD